MSERIEIIICALWIVHPVLETAIAIVMLRRGQHRQFKFFFAYVIAQILAFATIFPAYLYRQHAYDFYLEPPVTAVTVVLGFLAIYEASLDLFEPYQMWRDLGIMLLKWAGLLMLLATGIIVAFTSSPDISAWLHAVTVARSCLRCAQVGMVLLLLIFARYLELSKKRQGFGIALGFGIVAFVEMAIALSLVSDLLSDRTSSLLNVGTYIGPLMIWLGYALKSKAREAVHSRPQPQRWEQTLIDPLPSDYATPIFDGTIDFDLSRSQVAPSSAIYRELSLLESELNENIKALKFTSAQISRRLGRLNILARHPPTRGENTGDR